MPRVSQDFLSKPLPITALEARNSLEFMEHAFELFAKGEPFAVSRPDVDLSDYPGLEVTQTIRIAPKFGWAQMQYQAPHAEVSQIMFSSGTEGKPKAILIGGESLLDTENRLIEAQQPTSDIREYIGVPITYAFGLGRARVVSRVGGAFYLPEKFNPMEIRQMLEAGEINAISAVPSLWRTLLANPDFLGDAGHRVRWIEIGSQYMSVDEKLTMRRIFPNARMVMQYGLTEASRSTFIRLDNAPDEALESVGKPMGDTEVRINADGHICIRGSHLAHGMIRANGGFEPIQNEEGWFETKDVGELRDGYLYYIGRSDDQINLSGFKLAADTLQRELGERVALAPGAYAISSVPDTMRGDAILLADELSDPEQAGILKTALSEVLSARGIDGAGAIKTLSLDELPRTGSGKVRRKALRDIWEAEYAEKSQKTGSNKARKDVAGIFAATFPDADITPDKSFSDLGGDSLSYIAMAIDLERQLGSLPVDWSDMPIADLEALTSQSSSAFVFMDTPTVIRCVAICLIVLGHYGLFAFGGGSALGLFAVAGWMFSALTLPVIARNEAVQPIVSTLLRVAVLTFGITAVTYFVSGWGSWPGFLFIGNWVGLQTGPFWFVEVYLQLLALVALLLALPGVRGAILPMTFPKACWITVGFVCLAALSDALIDTHHLFRRLPHLLAWMFFIGMAAQQAQTLGHRVIVSLIALLGIGQYYWGMAHIEGAELLVVAMPVLLGVLIWCKSLPVPSVLVRPVRHIAAASLMIYLTHVQIRLLADKVADIPMALLFVIAIVLGTVGWMIYEKIEARVLQRLKRTA